MLDAANDAFESLPLIVAIPVMWVVVPVGALLIIGVPLVVVAVPVGLFASLLGFSSNVAAAIGFVAGAMAAGYLVGSDSY